MGARYDESSPGGRRVSYAALGPDLYDGTAGIGLYLAALYKATANEAFRHTALAALRQSVVKASNAAPMSKQSFYTGGLGVAWAAAVAADLLDEPESRDLALAAMSDLVGAPLPEESDLLLGLAGTIVGRLAVGSALGQDVLREDVSRLAHLLVRRGFRAGGATSWPSAIFHANTNLAGFSHGAAGIAFALLEAADATSDPSLRDVALEAFAYEQGLYDALARNWRDVRFEPPDGTSRSFVTFWCHGAGVARC
jgi:lantibiotic modifying enzyme